MNTSKALPRVRRRRWLAPDFLEERLVLSSGQGSTFAIMSGSITTAGQVSSLPFTVSSSMFTPTKNGKIELGIDITPVTSTSSTSRHPECSHGEPRDHGRPQLDGPGHPHRSIRSIIRRSPRRIISVIRRLRRS